MRLRASRSLAVNVPGGVETMRKLVLILLVLAAALAAWMMWRRPEQVNFAQHRDPKDWPIHDMDRPRPPVITPATASTQERAGQPPSDAIVLFDGKDLSKWESVKGGAALWKVAGDYFEVVPKTGGIQTKQGFGDCQLHVEWMAPDPPRGQSQRRLPHGPLRSPGARLLSE
jgi:hypothetical protein